LRLELFTMPTSLEPLRWVPQLPLLRSAQNSQPWTTVLSIDLDDFEIHFHLARSYSR
jgi:hypothetical protein